MKTASSDNVEAARVMLRHLQGPRRRIGAFDEDVCVLRGDRARDRAAAHADVERRYELFGKTWVDARLDERERFVYQMLRFRARHEDVLVYRKLASVKAGEA